MSKRIDKSWVVFASVQNDEHDHCVDIFFRPDNSFGFEEFRRDVEDGGAWTPTAYYSGAIYQTAEIAYAKAEESILWLAKPSENRSQTSAHARFKLTHFA